MAKLYGLGNYLMTELTIRLLNNKEFTKFVKDYFVNEYIKKNPFKFQNTKVKVRAFCLSHLFVQRF